MARQSHRLLAGGLVDRTRPLRFTFDGRPYQGYQGDTLASALLANGVTVVGRSFKYHRPRGIMAAGVEEPNAIVTVGQGAAAVPNLKATEVDLTDGLVATAVNCWPSARRDLGALIGLLGPFMPSGFYYKTFKWPHWHWYEGLVRRAAGLGKTPTGPDPDSYEHLHAHCDVLVVGTGPAGLAAAMVAGAAGARVLVVEQEAALGGSLLYSGAVVDGMPGREWAARRIHALAAMPEVTLLPRTTATGYYDHNALSLLQRIDDGSGRPRQRLWQVRARRVVLATGALERPLVFPGNDRPGVMLLSSACRYANHYGVAAGRRLVVFTNNDTAYGHALALCGAGITVAAVVDCREVRTTAAVALEQAGIPVIRQGVVERTHGRAGLTAVTIATPGGRRRVSCDALGMAGGWNPVVHLHCQAGGGLRWDEAGLMFTPGPARQACRSAGAGNGSLGLADCLAEGHAAGLDAVAACGLAPTGTATPRAEAASSLAIQALWSVPGGKAWVDFQNDVTADDIVLAAAENFRSVEHLKRYTTLGMAVDQGKTSNVNGLAILARQCGLSIPRTGTTRFRPPYTPVTLSAFRGPYRANLFRPRRLMPAHDWHQAHGAVFEDFSGWQRPAHYLRPGEDRDQAVRREALAVRTAAGLFEGSPLGKIEVKGPDAADFLDRVYVNTMSTLKLGRLRYGLMANENGVIMDDGVVARLAPDHFLVGTSSGNAGRVAEWLEEWLQCEWTGLRVLTAPVTSAWATLTLTGPRARAILDQVGVDFDPGAQHFPHMAFRDGHVAGIPARVARVSFTGEVSYEINVPAGEGTALWRRIMTVGAPLGLQPVGVDAWMDLRTEKGYLHVGADTDGTTTPLDVGWGPVIARKAKDFVGKRSLMRPDALRGDRLNFVGLEPVDPTQPLPVGAQLTLDAAEGGPTGGHVTSGCVSAVLGRPVALAMIRGGRDRMNQLAWVLGPSSPIPARIVPPLFYDPEGERLNA
ncbi:sarcosine oxidase subunit alpha family protein [Nitrospirillum sp. BR 11163]|uniref:sarcosine oxidase subunit alpha family protein n=1 Tax=Nitrospirillum sp. BR 11163 TaxID=3104323 RepID=UPI002AFFC548|nr:sarcosine oxidase subunit alpha family protein [Nitrospirillum sp. BR 11163]MEA1672718.1 sarcosine oxidase subunit alpha family protein [Nitrospirillum sp. BR 11163]